MFWGAAIVIFLAKIINFHNADTQGFWIEVSSQVETGKLNIRLKYRSSNSAFLGLFTVTSIGLIPWRVLDTYSASHALSNFLLIIALFLKEYGRFGGINERPSKFVQKPAFHNYSMKTTFQTLFTTHTMYVC